MARPVLVVFATFDPRGLKIGGIETHTRHILRHFPAGSDLLLVGLDEAGDLRPGRVIDLSFEGRAIRFLPLAHIPVEASGVAAQRLAGSTTLRFVLAGLRHIGALRRELRGRRASADLPRVEFAPLARLAGLPYLVTVHSQITMPEKTASLLQRFRRLRLWSEAYAFAGAAHVFAVTPAIHEALLAAYPALEGRSGVLPVPVDTRLFSPSPFPGGEVFHLAYAGRFGAEKDPALMFASIAALADRLAGRVRFHVLGADDPARFAEFAPIAALTQRHGPQTASGVAGILRACHAGLLTSHTEGLPCFLLETLASGRAFGGVALPSLAPFVQAGVSGHLAARAAEREETAQAVAGALLRTWEEIGAGTLVPETIAALAAPYAAQTLFREIFERHAALVN